MAKFNLDTLPGIFALAASEGFTLSDDEKNILRRLFYQYEGDPTVALITLDEWLEEAAQD